MITVSTLRGFPGWKFELRGVLCMYLEMAEARGLDAREAIYIQNLLMSAYIGLEIRKFCIFYSLYDVDDIVTIGREGLDSKYLTIIARGWLCCVSGGWCRFLHSSARSGRGACFRSLPLSLQRHTTCRLLTTTTNWPSLIMTFPSCSHSRTRFARAGSKKSLPSGRYLLC